MREQDRTLECEHSIYGFHKQVNLGERTWNDDLRAMSYSLGIAIVVLVAEQNVILQTSLFTAGMLRSQQPRRRAAAQRDELASLHSITSSARAMSVSGIWRPSALAVLRLIASSNLVACSIGRSPALLPLRILTI